MTLPVAPDWFRSRRLGVGVTLIDEPHVHVLLRANIFLVEGAARDLVIDTGMGIAPLKPALDRLRPDSRKSVVCVSTHAHLDHIGGAHEFEERLIHPAEAEEQAAPGPASLLREDWPTEMRAGFEAAGYPPLWEVQIDALPWEGYDPAGYGLVPAPATGLLEEGDRLDLGDRVLEVRHLPGHSPGGIGLFERATGILFSGDAIYDGPLIYEGPGMDLTAYRETFRKLEALPVTIVHGGHDPSFGAARMAEIIARYRALWAMA